METYLKFDCFFLKKVINQSFINQSFINSRKFPEAGELVKNVCVQTKRKY